MHKGTLIISLDSFRFDFKVIDRTDQLDKEVYSLPLVVIGKGRYLVDPASSHMLVSKIKPCMSKYKPLYGETANGSLYQL